MPDRKDRGVYATMIEHWMTHSLGVDKSFLEGEMPKDDWTLIIRLHALIEAALTNSIVKEFRSPKIKKIIEKLDTSNQSTGKLAFAGALSILDEKAIKYVVLLSELRNLCAHHARNFYLDLKTHLSGDENERIRFLKVSCFETGNLKRGALTEKMRQAASNPSKQLVRATFAVLRQLHSHDQQCGVRDFMNSKTIQRLEELQTRDQSNPKEQ